LAQKKSFILVCNEIEPLTAFIPGFVCENLYLLKPMSGINADFFILQIENNEILKKEVR
jgi:hypothetical protein